MRVFMGDGWCFQLFGGAWGCAWYGVFDLPHPQGRPEGVFFLVGPRFFPPRLVDNLVVYRPVGRYCKPLPE